MSMFEKWQELELGKKLSLIIAVGYLVVACFGSDVPVGVLTFLAYLIWPLGCIWFGDELGAWTGVLFPRPSITF